MLAHRAGPTVVHTRSEGLVDLPLPRIPSQGNDHVPLEESGGFRRS